MSWLTGINWLGLIGQCFVKSSWALLIAILLAGLMRRQSASLRHFVLSIFLVGLVFFPLFTAFPGGWQTGWLPSWLGSRGASQAEMEPAALEGSLLQHEQAAPASANSTNFQSGRSLRTLSSTSPWIEKYGRSLGAGLLLLWLGGWIVLISRLALGILAASRLTREGNHLRDTAWQKLLQRFISAITLRRKVDLKSHVKVAVPLTWGLWRPVILMPAGTENWTEEKRSSALFHELSHVKRADFLVTMLVRLSLALFWFNPLSWIVFRMLKNEQEKACDELVLRAGIKPSDYAASLLSFQRSASLAGAPSTAFLGALGMLGRYKLNDRLVTILRQKLAFKEVKVKTKIIVSVLAILTVAFIGLARPSGASSAAKAGLAAQDSTIGATESMTLGSAPQESQKSQESQEKKPAEKAEPQKEKKEKAKKETEIVVSSKEGQEGPVEITIIKEDSKKSIRVNKPVFILKKDEGEKKLMVLSEGKEVLVVEGDEVRLKVEGDRITHLKDGTFLKLDKGLLIRSMGKDEKGERRIIIEGEPSIKIIKEVQVPRQITLHIRSKGAKEETLFVSPRVNVEPLLIKETQREELKKKIAETQALLKEIEEKGLDEARLEAQRETLQELKETLENLKQELEKETKGLKALSLALELPERALNFSLVCPKVDLKIDSSLDVEEEGKDHTITIIDKDRSYTIVYTGRLRENQKEIYEKAVDNLKKGLPEGYELDSEFHEKSGTIVIKIKGHDTKENSREVVENLVKEFKEVLKKSQLP